MPAPFASVSDVAVVWRPLSDTEEAAAAVLVEVASAVVRARFSDIDARITAGTTPAELARHVVAMMVRRYLSSRGPNDPIALGTGPFSASYIAGADVEMGLYDSDLTLLSPPRGRRRSRSFGVGLGITPP